ncbi:MAG: transporter substrate-binding domain-containing protein [Alphaproteobacteria bacterium]|nr:transporter substrate-binding domain-containing protein [Alphaproteobacteria bacterium]
MKKRLLALVLVVVCGSSAFAADTQESVFERVNRTGLLRCGYFTWPPFLMIDPNTKQASGIYHDVIEEIGKQLHLKIEWTEDTGQANPFEGMKTGRFDMFCGPITPTPDRAKQVGFSRPFFYIPYYAYARADDARFKTAKDINDPKTKIAVIDGEFAYEIVKRDFPKASLLTLPALSDGAQVMMSVTSKKADIFLNDSAATAVFMDKNPDQIKIASKEPLRTLAAVIVLPQNDMAFKTMIDTVLDQLLEDRFVDSVVSTYALKGSAFLPVAKGYRLAKEPRARPAAVNHK